MKERQLASTVLQWLGNISRILHRFPLLLLPFAAPFPALASPGSHHPKLYRISQTPVTANLSFPRKLRHKHAVISASDTRPLLCLVDSSVAALVAPMKGCSPHREAPQMPLLRPLASDLRVAYGYSLKMRIVCKLKAMLGRKVVDIVLILPALALIGYHLSWASLWQTPLLSNVVFHFQIQSHTNALAPCFVSIAPCRSARAAVLFC